jgi:hypothetical protein
MKTRYAMILAVCAGLATGTAAAQEVFSCTIKKNGKQLTLSQTGNQVSYTYGRKGKQAELALTVSVDQAQWEAWDGFGRVHAYSVGILRGDHLYVVNTWNDSLDLSSGSGVRVEKGEQILAELECDPASVRGNLEAYVIGQKDLTP